MIHSESERQFYLGAAGIRLWYAREALPGAAASPDFDFTDADQSPAEPWAIEPPGARESQHPGSAPAANRSPGRPKPNDGARVANLQALMKDTASATAEPAKKPAASVKAEAAEPATPVTEAEPEQPGGLVPKLDLQIWQGSRSAIVASISGEASLRLQETLASNILKSLGESTLETVGPVRWPVFNNLKAPGNSMADLQTVLNQALTGLGERRLIVLGVNPPDEYAGEELWFTHISGAKATVSFSHSLAELATSPDLKRTLWQELKPLASQ